jgi:hypothetical protein
MEILCSRREDEVGECDGKNRHAEEESIGDSLRAFFGLSLICRKRHPFAIDVSARLVFFHVAGSLAVVAPAERVSNSPTAARIICRSSDHAAVKRPPLRVAFARSSISRQLNNSHNRSHRPRLAANPTRSVAKSSTSRHRDQRQRRTARPRRRSGDYGIDGNERTQTG